MIAPRLTVYPEYVRDPEQWLDPAVALLIGIAIVTTLRRHEHEGVALLHPAEGRSCRIGYADEVDRDPGKPEVVPAARIVGVAVRDAPAIDLGPHDGRLQRCC